MAQITSTVYYILSDEELIYNSEREIHPNLLYNHICPYGLI